MGTLFKDFQDYLEAEERRKTQLRNALGALDALAPIEPAAPTAYQPLGVDISGFQDQVDEALIPHEEKSAWGKIAEPFGAFAWDFLETGTFADVWVPEEVRKEFVFLEEEPETFAGKMGAGIGSLTGFVTGAPMRFGGAVARRVAKPFLTKAVAEVGTEVGNKYVVGSAAKVGRKIVDKATQSGIDKDLAEKTVRGFQSQVVRSRFTKNIAQNFTRHTDDLVDDLADLYVKEGKLAAKEAQAFKGFFKENFKKRPVQDLADLWAIRGGNPMVGNLIHEAIMFGAIDAASEGIRSAAEERPYDLMAPIWGLGVGAGFGALKWMAPAGKGAPFKADFMDGLKAAFRVPFTKKPFQGKGVRDLNAHSKWFGDVFDDGGKQIIVEGTHAGKSYRFNLQNPESLGAHFTETEVKSILSKELHAIQRREGRALMSEAVQEEFGSLAANWSRMVIGSGIMNARTAYEIGHGYLTGEGAEVEFEDVLPSILIGAWINRKGRPRTWDLNKRINKIRGGLRVLGVDTRNLAELPSFDPYVTGYHNPMNSHESLRKIRDKAEELNIISDDFDVVRTETLDVLRGEQSVSGSNADPTAPKLDIFHGIYRLLRGSGKYTRSLDDISTTDAAKLEKMVQEISWEELGNRPITTQRDMYRVVDKITEGASNRFENLIVDSVHEVGTILGISIDPSNTVIGKLPRLLTYSQRISDMAFNGELGFLKDVNGEVLSGNDAVVLLENTYMKTGRLFEFMKAEKGIGRAEDSNNVIDMANEVQVEKLFNAINKLELTITSSADIKGDFKFDILEGLDELSMPMLLNQAKKASKGISDLFDKNNPDRSTVNQLQLLLMKTGLLQEGLGRPAILIPDITKIKITGMEDEAKVAHAKKILGNVLSIIGSKGQYQIGTRPTRDIEIPYSTIVGNTEQSLSKFLERRGMRTAPYLMDQYNNFVTNYILKEKIKNSNVDMPMVNFIHSLMNVKDVPFAEFHPGGKGKIAGWTLHKIKLHPGATEGQKIQAEQYNKYVDKIFEAGKTDKGNLIIKGPELTLVNPEVADLITTSMHYNSREGKTEAKESLLQFLNAVEMNHGSFKIMAHQFVNSGNGENATRLLQWLVQSKIITREDTDGLTRYSLNADKVKGIDTDVIQMLMTKMTKFGISREEADRMQQIAHQEVEDMQFHNWGVRTKDQRLTRDQFFKTYYPEDPSVQTGEGQQLELESILYDGKGDPHPNGVNRLLEKMSINIHGADIPALEVQYVEGGLQRLKEARDDARHLVLGQLGNESRVFFTHNNGNLKAINKSVSLTPFNSAMNEMGISMVPIIGSNQFFYKTPDGNLRAGRFTIFDGESDYIPSATKGILRKNLTNLENSLNSLVQIKVRNSSDSEEVFEAGAVTGDGGMVLMRIANTVSPFAMLKSDLPNIVTRYREMMGRLEADESVRIDSDRWQSMKSTLKRLESNPESRMEEHETALRDLLFERISTSSKDKSFFVDLLNGKEDVLKAAKRFSLFHTPAYRYAEADFAANNLLLSKYEREISKHYAKKKTAGVVIWNDVEFADIYNNLSEKNKIFWDNNMYGRNSESMFDSISFISSRYRDYLALSHGQYANSDSRIFKPAISSNGDVLLFGKTAFVYDPTLDSFFERNGDVDVLATASASKIYGKNQWKILDANMDKVPNLSNLSADGYTQQIPLNMIGIKSDRVKDVDPARVSQQLFNYMDSKEAGRIYEDMYDAPLDNAINDVRSLLNNPYAMRSFFSSAVYDESFVETMIEGAAGSQKLGAVRMWADYGNPMEIGENIVMSQVYKKVIQPILAPKSELDGVRYGGKAVFMPSFNKEYRDLRFTKVDSEGELSHYGEIVLPYRDQFESIKTVTGKNKDLKVKILNTKTNKLLDPSAKESPISDLWDQIDTLGDLHAALGGDRGAFQVVIVNTRYPRTRPNDLGLLGLRGFNAKGSGNAAIVNAVDVLNIYEGDYDIDKADYFWAQNETTFKHIQESKQRFVQGIDPDNFPSSIKNIGLHTMPAKAENELWHRQISNSSTLGRGIGLVQKVPRIINHIRDLAETRIAEDGTEQYVIMEGKDWEVRVDYNNKEWFQRMVLEAQTIIDAGSHVNRDVLNQIYEWRDDFLFPLIEDTPQGTWGKIRNKVGFLRDLNAGDSPGRVRIFRKFDLKEGKEVNLESEEIQTIKEIMKNYSDFLQLGTDIYDNTGRGKSPAYSDVIDVSQNYFGFLGDLSNSIYWNLHSKRTPDGKNQYRNMGRFKDMWQAVGEPILRKGVQWRVDNHNYTPVASDYYRLPGTDTGPFPKAVIEKATRLAGGRGGNVFDRIMWKMWDADPLKARDYTTFSADEMVQMDRAMRMFYGEGAYRGLDEFTSNVLQFATTMNKAQGTLRYLKKQYGVISKLRISEKKRKEKIDQLNASIKVVEDQVLSLTSAEYKKTKSAKDLEKIGKREALVTFLDLNDREVQDGAVQYYTMHALTRVEGTGDGVGMRRDIDQLRAFEKLAFGDMGYNEKNQVLGYTMTYREAKTLLSERQRQWLGDFPQDMEVHEIIEHKLDLGVQVHGMSFLYNYGQPVPHKNAIGIFNGVPHTITYGKTGRFSRAMQYISNRAVTDDNFKRTLKLVAPIADYYRNYFQKNHQLLLDNPLINPETGLNYEMLRFPKFQKTLQSSFDNFSSIKWQKATGKENPFQIFNDDLLSFYREIFRMNGMEAEFTRYMDEMSYVNSIMMGSELTDPFAYMHMMSSLDSKVHEFIKLGFAGGFSDQGKYQTPESMKNNPVWILLGGAENIKGISMNPRARMSPSKQNNMVEFSRQANDLKNTTIKEGTVEILSRRHRERKSQQACKPGGTK